MRAKDFLTELGNAPYRYKYRTDLSDPGSEWYFSSNTPNGELLVEFEYLPAAETLFLNFSINHGYNVTNKGDQFKIFSTVLEVASRELRDLLEMVPRTRKFVFTSTDRASRASLYRRGAPKISAILGPDWTFRERESADGITQFIWDRKEQL